MTTKAYGPVRVDGDNCASVGVVGVEGAHAHEPMHAHLGAQMAIGPLALHGEAHRVDPSLDGLLEVDDLGLVAPPLAPAEEAPSASDPLVAEHVAWARRRLDGVRPDDPSG